MVRPEEGLPRGTLRVWTTGGFSVPYTEQCSIWTGILPVIPLQSVPPLISFQFFVCGCVCKECRK